MARRAALPRLSPTLTPGQRRRRRRLSNAARFGSANDPWSDLRAGNADKRRPAHPPRRIL